MSDERHLLSLSEESALEAKLANGIDLDRDGYVKALVAFELAKTQFGVEPVAAAIRAYLEAQGENEEEEEG